MLIRKLNGWRRLWIVAAVLWVIWSCLWVLGKLPSEATQNRFWANSMSLDVMFHYLQAPKRTREEGERRLQEARAGRTDKQFIDALPQHFPDVNFNGTRASYKRDMKDLKWVQLQRAALAVALMLIPPTLAYWVGLVIAWIVVGFRKAPSNTRD